jgi:hypothetical protein
VPDIASEVPYEVTSFLMVGLDEAWFGCISWLVADVLVKAQLDALTAWFVSRIGCWVSFDISPELGLRIVRDSWCGVLSAFLTGFSAST